MNKLRLRCLLLGCKASNSAIYTCDYCGTYYMEYSWIGTTPLQNFIWKAQALFKNPIFGKCEQCGKWIFRPAAYNDDFCSSECYSNWLPF